MSAGVPFGAVDAFDASPSAPAAEVDPVDVEAEDDATSNGNTNININDSINRFDNELDLSSEALSVAGVEVEVIEILSSDEEEETCAADSEGPSNSKRSASSIIVSPDSAESMKHQKLDDSRDFVSETENLATTTSKDVQEEEDKPPDKEDTRFLSSAADDDEEEEEDGEQPKKPDSSELSASSAPSVPHSDGSDGEENSISASVKDDDILLESDPDCLFGSEDDEDKGYEDEPQISMERFPPAVLARGKRTHTMPTQLIHNSETVYLRKPVMEQSIFKKLFGSRLLLEDQDLKETRKIKKTFVENGIRFQLICTKMDKRQESAGKQHWKHAFLRLYYVAVSGPMVSTLNLPSYFNGLADFQGQATRKIMSRFELMVTPAASSKFKNPDGTGKLPYLFELGASQFEMIGTDFSSGSDPYLGCGFIPEDLIAKLTGDRDTLAVQIRFCGPKIGLGKGVLMRKRGISKIQITPSMLKVGKSTSPNSKLVPKNKVFLLFNRLFPSDWCKMVERNLNPHLKPPPESERRNLNNHLLGDMVLNVLNALGVDQETIQQYALDSSEFWAGHNHACCLGVADPTDSLPAGTVFVTGMGVSKSHRGKDRIFVTRYPCTEANDGKVLKRITKKPPSMGHDNWDWLCLLPFGVIIFANSAAQPIPPTIANGDLDGDLYVVLWDLVLLSLIQEPPSVAAMVVLEQEEDDFLINQTYGKGGIVKRKEGNDYVVLFKNGTEIVVSKNAVMAGRKFMDKIIGHRACGKNKKIEVHVIWKEADGDKRSDDWQPLRTFKQGMETELAEYAMEKKITDAPGWEWTKELFRDAILQDVTDHNREGPRGSLQFYVTWDTGKLEWIPIEKVKDFMETEGLLEKIEEYASCQTNLRDESSWQWVRQELRKSRKNWLEQTQELLANGKRLRDYNELKEKLHFAYFKHAKNHGVNYNETIKYGRAFKQAQDLYKHGGQVPLPNSLSHPIPKDIWPLVKWDYTC